MTLREWEICSGSCPPERPCPAYPNDSDSFRRLWDGLPPGPAPEPPGGVESWPWAAQLLARQRKPADRGLGDTLAHFLGKFGADAFKRWYRKLTGADCGCADRQAALNARFAYPAPPPSVRNLLYHVYPIRSSIWQWNVGQLLRRINLFNGRRVVKIATDHRTDSARDVKDLFAGRVHEFVEVPNRPDESEMNGFEDFFARVETTAAGHVTLYAHAKGVNRMGADHIRAWVEILYETYLDYWPLVEQRLQRYPVVGSLKRLGQPDGWPQQSDWHYSGSWLWFRNRDLFARPNWREADRRRIGIELYPSQHFTRAEAGVLFHESPLSRESLIGLYDPRYVTGTILPALEAWRAEHAAERKDW